MGAGTRRKILGRWRMALECVSVCVCVCVCVRRDLRLVPAASSAEKHIRLICYETEKEMEKGSSKNRARAEARTQHKRTGRVMASEGPAMETDPAIESSRETVSTLTDSLAALEVHELENPVSSYDKQTRPMETVPVTEAFRDDLKRPFQPDGNPRPTAS